MFFSRFLDGCAHIFRLIQDSVFDPKIKYIKEKILPVYCVLWRTRLKTLQWRAERTCDRSSPWRGNPCPLHLIDFRLICPSRCITCAYITRMQTVLQCQPPLFGRSMGDFRLICPSRCITGAYITRLQTVLQCQPTLFGRSMGPRLG